jgi:hypothetical protein
MESRVFTASIPSPRVRKEKRKILHPNELQEKTLKANALLLGTTFFSSSDQSAYNELIEKASSVAPSNVSTENVPAQREMTSVTFESPARDSTGRENKKQTKMPHISSLPDFFDLSTLESGFQQHENSETAQALSLIANRMKTSMSVPSLHSLGSESHEEPSTATRVLVNPESHLTALVQQSSPETSLQTFPALELNEFFLKMTEDNISAYTPDIISAVRNQDLDQLQTFLDEGRQLQCCNRFGESVLHLACRHGSTSVVRFLLEEANLSLKVRDDYGRTPLHDACWTREPETELVKLLVTRCPDLLYVKDKRGFTPLSYVRRDHWETWCDFLDENRHLLYPAELSQMEA